MDDYSAEQIERYRSAISRLSEKFNGQNINSTIDRVRAEAALMIVALNPGLQIEWWNECCNRLEKLIDFES